MTFLGCTKYLIIVQDKKNKFKLNIELCDFLGPIKYLIIVHKELFADVSRIGLCDDDYDEISLLIFLHDNHHR